MTASEIRKAFFDFFAEKDHEIVPSAPMVVKNDPTLMFTNAGMNQFKDIFLGNRSHPSSRVANSQKCLRVSGKHNDLEEVGHDTYHHTMFEMLGNWSFGDYFKKEAIAWAMEFLTGVLKIPAGDLYATVFEGDRAEGIPMDEEAMKFWHDHLPGDHILTGSKKDNFWEMGETGPCGPCSEIHVDLRTDREKAEIPGRELVNAGDPRVIEIWNLVFIQFNRKTGGKLEQLPARHVDTGMGFERLCRIVQNKASNYDTDLFKPIIREIGFRTGHSYGEDPKTDTAMRVVADHLRAISFSIADGQIPSNTGAGYVIRRILRRAVRYCFSFLKQEHPVIYSLVPTLVETMGNDYPELVKQQELIMKVIKEEESSFLRTLETGIRKLDEQVRETLAAGDNTISGKAAFELYDTYGFPLDLTDLILREHQLSVRREEFDREMKAQKERSRNAASVETGDWVRVRDEKEAEFTGYDDLASDVLITRYRKIRKKGETRYQLVFNSTPFYAESGGQVGDTGFISSEGEKIRIVDTQKENELVVHITDTLPAEPAALFRATVDRKLRENTARNHSATHLLHHVLREVLGKHVEQKGSLVHPDYLRFDFSHFRKVTDEELTEIEKRVNRMIRQDIRSEVHARMEMEKAKNMGALALFGEKYADKVRVVKFGDSIELCGGTHVHSTGQIGIFKIVSESAVAAGIRRIEAVTGEKAEEYFRELENTQKELQHLLRVKSGQLVQSVKKLQEELQELRKKTASLHRESLQEIKKRLKISAREIDGIYLIAERIDVEDAGQLRDLSFQLRQEISPLFLVLGAESGGKALLSVMISDDLVKDRGFHAGNMIREMAREIQGGGGGQPFFATAGGKDPAGLDRALEKALSMVTSA
ncbi:MAG TPA: alanine--tRNA ligase [Bacteroidetes bacterium]|nr:alanine--tRNA ligase [Bacteroidota bacterium]